jgi:hypothetical protein
MAEGGGRAAYFQAVVARTEPVLGTDRLQSSIFQFTRFNAQRSISATAVFPVYTFSESLPHSCLPIDALTGVELRWLHESSLFVEGLECPCAPFGPSLSQLRSCT